MAEKPGIKAAISALPLEALGLSPQRSMFGADMPAPPPAERRGRGRPPGSPNRRTILARGILARRTGHALEELDRIAFATPKEIATAWGIDRDLAARLKLDALKERAEYDHVKRRHLTVDGELGSMTLAIFNGAPTGAAAIAPPAAGLGPIAGLFPQGEAEQRVIEAEAEATNAEATNAGRKAEADQ